MPIPFSTLKFRLIQQAWKFAKFDRWLHRFPFLRQRMRRNLNTPAEKNDATIIPIHQTISSGENTALPYPILKPLIEKSEGHFTLNNCPCRTAENCRTYPHDFGCLYLGPAVDEIPSGVGKHITTEEAIDHMEHGIQHGLVPMIVHAKFDASMLSIDYTHMLAVCFCCDCCCTVRHHLRLGPSTFDNTIHRLAGLTVEVTDHCTACGICITACPVQAITLTEKCALIDQLNCKGCGLCASVCPQNAIEIQIEELETAIRDLYARIRSRTEIGI